MKEVSKAMLGKSMETEHKVSALSNKLEQESGARMCGTLTHWKGQPLPCGVVHGLFYLPYDALVLVQANVIVFEGSISNPKKYIGGPKAFMGILNKEYGYSDSKTNFAL
eukprot:4652364-Pyramimonas_sp.AAC.3